MSDWTRCDDILPPIDPEPVEHPADVHPLAIINRAVMAGVDPDKLQKLMDLQERYDANEARKAYNIAMKACQEAMPVVVKNCENKHTHSRYANLEAVAKTIKPVITQHGFSLSFGEGEPRVANHILVACDCMHEAGHTQRYELNCPYDTSGAKGGSNKTDIQGMGSSVSYARRYLTTMIFNVTISDEDDDGTGGSPGKVSEKQVETLREWMNKLPQANQLAFLDWLEVDYIESIPAADFQRALTALQGKVRQLEKK